MSSDAVLTLNLKKQTGNNHEISTILEKCAVRAGRLSSKASAYSIDDKVLKICLFVASSDNTKDVFRNVMASYEKFWRNCRYGKYVGLNSRDSEIGCKFTVMTAPVSSWRAELLTQIEALPGNISHVLLMLDDFLLLSPVDEERLDQLLAKAVTANYAYLRLVPRTSAFVFQVLRQARNKLSGRDCEVVPPGSPYFSSLQPALWQRHHLSAMLRLPGSIWDFENQYIAGTKHHAIACSPPLRCVHVVEKGAWMADAALRFNKLGLPFSPGSRPQRPISEIPLLWYRRLKFTLIGYAGIRLRTLLSRLTS